MLILIADHADCVHVFIIALCRLSPFDWAYRSFCFTLKDYTLIQVYFTINDGKAKNAPAFAAGGLLTAIPIDTCLISLVPPGSVRKDRNMIIIVGHHERGKLLVKIRKEELYDCIGIGWQPSRRDDMGLTEGELIFEGPKLLKDRGYRMVFP